MKTFIITAFLFSLNSYAEYPYLVVDKSYTDKEGSVTEVKESTPIKSQDGIGVCYGFTTTSLLETYRCRELNLDCSNPKEMLSTFDVTSYYGENDRSLSEAGNVAPILKKLLKQNPRSVAREECIPYSSLVHTISDKKKTLKRNEGKGWDYLISKWNEYKGKGKKSNDCVSCLVNDVKNTLVNLKTPADQIADAFTSASDLDDFLYKSIVPKECLKAENQASIPDFKVNFYPDGLSDTTDDMLEKKVSELLNANIPIEMGICADDSYTPNCEEKQGHSIALYGIKEVCNKSGDCKKVVKIKNSYGKSWQDKNGGGWIDLRELVRSSNSLQSYQNITWITKP